MQPVGRSVVNLGLQDMFEKQINDASSKPNTSFAYVQKVSMVKF